MCAYIQIKTFSYRVGWGGVPITHQQQYYPAIHCHAVIDEAEGRPGGGSSPPASDPCVAALMEQNSGQTDQHIKVWVCGQSTPAPYGSPLFHISEIVVFVLNKMSIFMLFFLGMGGAGRLILWHFIHLFFGGYFFL